MAHNNNQYYLPSYETYSIDCYFMLICIMHMMLIFIIPIEKLVPTPKAKLSLTLL